MAITLDMADRQAAFMRDYVRLMEPMVRAVADVDLMEPSVPYAWDDAGRFIRRLTPAQEIAREQLWRASEDVIGALLRKYDLTPGIFPLDVRKMGLDDLIRQQRGY